MLPYMAIKMSTFRKSFENSPLLGDFVSKYTNSFAVYMKKVRLGFLPFKTNEKSLIVSEYINNKAQITFAHKFA